MMTLNLKEDHQITKMIKCLRSKIKQIHKNKNFYKMNVVYF
jgi:hypothetical protein